jgi:hypothetical protein
MSGCFGLLFCDCGIFHGEAPFDVRFLWGRVFFFVRLSVYLQELVVIR